MARDIAHIAAHESLTRRTPTIGDKSPSFLSVNGRIGMTDSLSDHFHNVAFFRFVL
jgi:hypothetical protein